MKRLKHDVWSVNKLKILGLKIFIFMFYCNKGIWRCWDVLLEENNKWEINIESERMVQFKGSSYS